MSVIIDCVWLGVRFPFDEENVSKAKAATMLNFMSPIQGSAL
jgi:hypothetical protein